jgi:hypothetical protein
MGKFYGKVTDRKGQPLEGVEILFIDLAQEVLASAYSSQEGDFYIQWDQPAQGMLSATAGKGDQPLGAWFMNLAASRSCQVDLTLGNVEFLKFQRVRREASGEEILRFQLVQLEKVLGQERELSPALRKENLRILRGGVLVEDFTMERILRKLPFMGSQVEEITLRLPLGNRGEDSLLELVYSTPNAFGMLKSF